MPQLPTDALPAAAFLVRHLYRPIETTAGSSYSAIAETERLGDDNWFWSDDNAKVLEFMSRPDVWRRFPQETSEILRFVRSMCHGPYVFRRVSAPRLDLVGSEGAVATYHHSLMSLKYDAGRGAVIAGVRFHDDRNGDHLVLGGNYVEFTYRGHRFKEELGAGTGDTRIERNGRLLVMRHSAGIDFLSGGRPIHLGRLTDTYTFDARSMVFDVEAALDIVPGLAVKDVVLTIATAGLPYNPLKFLVTNTDPGAPPLFGAGKPSERLLSARRAPYYMIRQQHISADSLAVHSIPRGPQAICGFETRVATENQLERVFARYAFPGTLSGARCVAGEQKLITGGGFYDRVADYAALIRQASATRDSALAACDFSISYDYGVTINAFAKCFAASARSPGLAALPEAELRALVDAYLGHYREIAIAGHRAGKSTVFSRELAFVILAVATMRRSTGAVEYLDQIGPLCEILLDLERPYTDCGGEPASGFVMRNDAPLVAHVDCHSAALLALVQAARLAPEPRLIAAIDRGLRAYCLDSCALTLGEPRRVDGIATLVRDAAGNRHSEPAFWNFKAGLTLRLFTALRNAPEPELRAVAARHRDRLELFELILRRQIARSLAENDGEIELRCSDLSGETNSETQPWVMLGLLGHPAD
jgi:hypothetical protein